MSQINEELLEAVENGRLDLVEALITEGADVNTRGFFKVTPLMQAAADGQKDIVQYPLSCPNIDVGALNSGGTNALMTACRKGHLAIVKILLADPRTDANQLGKFGGTALMNAAGFGHIEVVKEFLKVNGISLAPTYTEKKHSPITIARQNGYKEIAQLLEDFAATQQTIKPAVPKPPAPGF